MAVFGGMKLTSRGRNLQAKAQTGIQLQFTRMAVGDGELGTSIIDELNALKHEVKSYAISKLKVMSGGKAVVGFVLSNQEIVSGFYFREVGVFAQDPDVGEILYCYANAGATAEYIPAGGGADVIEKEFDCIAVIGNASNVSAVIDDSLVFYSKTEELTVDQTQAPASPGNGKISQLFSWLANRIIGITGKLNWWESPDTTLANAKAHIDAIAPHTGHETPAGAQAKVDALAGVGNTKTVKQLDDEITSHLAEDATTSTKGHVQLGTTSTTAAVGNHNHSGVYEPANANIVKTNVAATMAAILTAQNNTSYTTKQVRNIILSTADPSGGSNGDIWIKYKP